MIFKTDYQGFMFGWFIWLSACLVVEILGQRFLNIHNLGIIGAIVTLPLVEMDIRRIF